MLITDIETKLRKAQEEFLKGEDPWEISNFEEHLVIKNSSFWTIKELMLIEKYLGTDKIDSLDDDSYGFGDTVIIYGIVDDE